MRPLVFALTLLVTVSACRRAEPPPPEAPLAAPDTSWTRVEPGGETICSNGTPFAFYTHAGNPEKLLLYFQGGGACWFGESCDLAMTPSYDPVVDENDNPAADDGLFAYDNPANPFADYTAVFIPYCTADVHTGDEVTTYPVAATDSTEAHEVTIQHKGYVNVRAALVWAFEHVTAPQRVFVAGSSAGAFPSAFYLPHVAEQYPDALIAQLADGAGGYRGMNYAAFSAVWGTQSTVPDYPEYADFTATDLRLESYLIAAARRYPRMTLAQYNTAEDETQLQFLALGGITNKPLLGLLEANYADIRRVVDNVRTYTAGGTLHTILTRPEFYTYAVGGVRFRDWLAALANGEPVDDVMCSDCATAPADAAIAEPATAEKR